MSIKELGVTLLNAESNERVHAKNIRLLLGRKREEKNQRKKMLKNSAITPVKAVGEAQILLLPVGYLGQLLYPPMGTAYWVSRGVGRRRGHDPDAPHMSPGRRHEHKLTRVIA